MIIDYIYEFLIRFGLSALFIICLIYLLDRYFSKKRKTEWGEFKKKITSETRIYLEDTLPRKKISGAAALKKQAILDINLKNFYYIDKEQVNNLYSQAFKEIEPSKIQTKKSKNTKTGFDFKFKHVRDDANEVMEEFNIEQTPSRKYNKVEKYLIEKGDVTFALEEFEYDKSHIDKFNSMCKQMETKFRTPIPLGVQEEYIEEKMKEFAIKCLEKISKSEDYISIHSLFTVIEIKENEYILSLNHSLNKHIRGRDKNVTFQIICTKKDMNSSGINAFKKDKLINITCLGIVIGWNENDKTLEINPIAIY